jgi:hypothetical protein
VKYYHWADDGLALWDALYTFVSEVINSQYPDDDSVANDAALQGWVQELTGQTVVTVRINQFPDVVQDRQTLITAVTHIIWQPTVHHSSLNYPQFYYEGYSGNYVGALWQAPPDQSDSTVDESYFIASLPPDNVNKLATAIADLLSTPIRFSGKITLWDYANEAPSQEYLSSPLNKLKQTLASIKTALNKRNKDSQHSGQFSYRQYQTLNPQPSTTLSNLFDKGSLANSIIL